MSFIRFGTDTHAMAQMPLPRRNREEIGIEFFSVGVTSEISPAEMARLKYVLLMGMSFGFAIGILFSKLKYLFILGVGAGIAAGVAMRRT